MIKIEVNGHVYAPEQILSGAADQNLVRPATRSVSDLAVPPGFNPTAGQQQAAEAVAELRRRPGPGLHAIVGYAGTGKTTMIRMLGSAFGSPHVVAPTGKAALRVSEASGLRAETIHRWLYSPGDDAKTGKTRFDRRKDLYIPSSKLVLIDEASMVQPDLWAEIWRVARLFDLKIVAIGDGFQLPPVQDKNAPAFSLLDPTFIASHGGTITELTEVLRQAQDSPIVRASMRLREGGGVRALAELNKVQRENLIDTCVSVYQAGGVVISATNNTRFAMNAEMRRRLFPVDPALAFWPQPGETLLVTRNNYQLDLYNGEQARFDGWRTPPQDTSRVRDRYTGAEADIWYGEALVNGRPSILAINTLHGDIPGIGGYALTIGAETWARSRGCWDGEKPTAFLQANFGYCYTAHKSQGSEWPYALVLLEPNVKLDVIDGRRWAYTAVTRAKTAAAVFFGRP